MIANFKRLTPMLALMLAGCAGAAQIDRDMVNAQGYQLSPKQMRVLRDHAERRIPDTVKGNAPLQLRGVNPRLVELKTGGSYLEFCGYAHGGKKTAIGRDIQQLFYGRFSPADTARFEMEIPRSDGHLARLLRKCDDRDLSS